MSESSLQFDKSLLFSTGALLFIGLVMVCSASITVADSRLEQPLYFFIRQFAFAAVGIVIAWGFISVRLAVWQRIAPQLLMAGVAMLIMVLIPGVGREVNGSSRWLPLGPVNLQVAELMVRCAMQRKESRGLHYTLDYPELAKDSGPTILTPEKNQS